MINHIDINMDDKFTFKEFSNVFKPLMKKVNL